MAAPKENIAIAKNMYGLFNDRKLDELTKCVTNDVTWTNLATGETFKGPSGFREFCQKWITAFSDCRVDLQNQVADEGTVVSEFVGRGTHDGPMTTPQGTIAPTKKKIDVRFCEILRITNGKVSEAHLYFDTATMLRQLGVSPEAIGSR